MVLNTATESTTRVRYSILAMIFIASTLNYAARNSLSMAGAGMQKELHFNALQLGFLGSAFGYSYVVAQLPSGWLLDRFGTKNVYALAILIWSSLTFLMGLGAAWGGIGALSVFFSLRLMLGLAEAPAFPGNSRIVAAWFPATERGGAAAVFNASQYFAPFIFLPLSGWLATQYGWRSIYFVTGGIGVVLAAIWMKTIHSPLSHPRVSTKELEFIEKGGALVALEKTAAKSTAASGAVWQLLRNRMLLGVYVAQFGINTITVFFGTWFPLYLVQERHMSILKAGFTASLPALCGFLGGVLGGVLSDALLRSGKSLSIARKTPIILGMTFAMLMVGCNYTSSVTVVVVIMSLALLGKGLGALGWAVVADTSPKEVAGLSGGLFNMCGNLSTIATPLAIGAIVNATHSYRYALVYVAANAALAIFGYAAIVGEIRRVELKTA